MNHEIYMPYDRIDKCQQCDKPFTEEKVSPRTGFKAYIKRIRRLVGFMPKVLCVPCALAVSPQIPKSIEPQTLDMHP